jgi:hypothetical protein
MNPEAIMTPGGIADQLTRGLSGLGQSFARREELRYQGQRDRMADDRYTAEMALRQQAQERADARMALEDRRYGEQQARLGRMDQLALEDRQRAQADAERKRRAMYPEDYVNSPDPQQSRSAQEALRRQQYGLAFDKGYVSPDQMQTLPGNDFRVPMQPGQRLFGPVPGSAAAQGLEARSAREKPQRDFEGELATKIKATSERDRIRYVEASRRDQIDQINKQIDRLLKERAGTMPLEAGAENSWGFDYSDAEIAANPANVKYAILGEQIKKLEADRDALGSTGGAAGALGAPSQVAPSNTGNIEDDIANGAPSFKP